MPEGKRYKNISTVTQLDILPGETAERTISEDKEERMVSRGAIEVVSTESEENPAPESEESSESSDDEETSEDAEDSETKEPSAPPARGGGLRGRRGA